MHDSVPSEQRRSLTRATTLVAALAIVLGAMHVASSLVGPILLAIVLALIFWPLYVWLRGHRLGTFSALATLLVALVVGVGLIVLVLAYSISGLADQLSFYTDNLSARLQSADAWFASRGFTDVHLASAPATETIASGFSAIVGGLASGLVTGLFILLLLMFCLAEGPAIVARMGASLERTDPTPARMAAFGRDVAQYFVLRAAVNALTGAGVAVVLWVLGVDFPLLWGVLTFFLSFVPYVGMFVASVPSVLLAWAEYDLAHALVVIVALTTVNAVAENIVQPALMHKGLNLSPTFVLVSVFFWSGVLGTGGAFLAIPMSLGLLTILANFPEARWFVDAVTTKSSTDEEGAQASP